MKSRTTTRFRAALAKLPVRVRRQARRTYRVFAKQPTHPSLQFKKVHPTQPIYSVRVGRGWRAVGVVDGDDIVWFWIGSHADYDKLLAQL